MNIKSRRGSDIDGDVEVEVGGSIEVTVGVEVENLLDKFLAGRRQ